MKLKGVNAFEQHIEKIVLVAVSLVFLVVLAMQFLLEPNRVKVLGSTQAVPPGKAFLAVETKAKDLQTQMVAAADTVLPPAPKFDLVNQLQSRRTLKLAAGKPVELGVAPQIEGTRATTASAGNDRIQPLEVPPPTKLVVFNHSNTFSPTEPINTPGLKPYLPQEQPLDKHSVSVACSFDGTALKGSLARGDETALKPIPTTWYREGMGLLATKVERQEQKADGSWSDAVEIATPPGRLTLEPMLKDVRSTPDLMDVVTEAAAAADDLLRPEFYQIIAGEPFKAPTDLNAGAAVVNAAAPKEVQDLVRERKDKVLAVERIKKSKADLEKDTGGRNRPSPGGGGGGGGKGGAGGGGGGGGDGGAQERQQKELQTKLANFDKQIKAAEDRIAVIDTKLKDLGFDTDGKPGAPAPAVPGNQTGTPTAAKSLLDDPDVRIWTHDLSVVPGKTYRYRLKVAVNNPAFARTSALVKEQQELAGSPLVYSAPSAWSDPIQVMADQYYFVTSAVVTDDLGPARATAEVFKFFYGYYRRGAVNLEPGDPISTSIKLPDPNKLPIYDVTALQNGVLPPAPGVPAPAPNIPAPRPPERGGGGGKGGGLAPPPEREAAGGGGQPGEPAKVLLPANSKPFGKPNIAAAFDLIFLDVIKSIGLDRSQAYLRGDKGQILVSVPDEERKATTFLTVVQSAKDGENQGIVTPTETKEPKGPVIKPKGPAPKVNPGGGGGGGTG